MRTITVTGRGAVTVVPDSAVVRASLVHTAASVADAVAGCDSAARLCGDVARRFTDAARIASQRVRVGHHHDREGRVTGFEARHSMTIGCADLDAAGELVAALATEVGDRLRIDDISLEVSDSTAARLAAREAAYADAVAQATHLAGLAGAEVGEVQAIGEASPDQGGDDGIMPVALAAVGKVGLEAGESSVSQAVRVVFQLL